MKYLLKIHIIELDKKLECAPMLSFAMGKKRLHETLIYQLMNEAEYLMKNYGDRKEWITPSEISIILHMVRKPNSIIVLLFIHNNS